MLTRCRGQSFVVLPDPALDPATPIGDLFRQGPIKVSVTQVRGQCVRFSVVADPRLLILREELQRDP